MSLGNGDFFRVFNVIFKSDVTFLGFLVYRFLHLYQVSAFLFSGICQSRTPYLFISEVLLPFLFWMNNVFFMGFIRLISSFWFYRHLPCLLTHTVCVEFVWSNFLHGQFFNKLYVYFPNFL